MAAARPYGARLSRAFFARPCLEVAPELVGACLVRTLPGGERLVGRLVEVEAYRGDGSDPGAHSHRGPTPRNRAMFGPPGRLYVYRSYGIHICANAVCEPAGAGAAVLFRAVEPRAGEARMRRLRGLPPHGPSRAVAGGPGRLCAAFGIGMGDYGTSLLRGAVEVRRPARGEPAFEVAVSRRIGLGKGVELPYRFFARGHPCVSVPPR